MLKVEKVTKTFGDVVALEDISFEVKKGEFVFIVGPSGSGKTTLVKLILRQLVPTKGKISINGKDITKLSEEDIPKLRQKIGVVFQDFKVLSERTLRENVEVGLAVVGIEEDKWKPRVDRVLELVGLKNRSELFPAQLSGGELQRASLARALVVNPDLVLADEPTGNLDWDTAEEIVKLLAKINKEGKTVVMATHHRGIVSKMKKRVIELKQPKSKTKTKQEKKS